jgi:hypothetical protein
MVLMRDYASGSKTFVEQITTAYKNSPNVYGDASNLPAELQSGAAAELNVPAGKARLNVVAFTGLSPLKTEEKLAIPLTGLAFLSAYIGTIASASGGAVSQKQPKALPLWVYVLSGLILALVWVLILSWLF